jgi:energy-coupling factor transporter transmembrane protein EcfT
MMFRDSNPWVLNPKPFALFIVGFAVTMVAVAQIVYRGAPNAPWWAWPILALGIVALLIGVAWMFHEKEDLDEVIEGAETGAKREIDGARNQ